MSARLEFTSADFLHAGSARAGIPLLVDSTGRFIAPVCDYLRYLVLHGRLHMSSAKTYAYRFQLFWRYLESVGIDYLEVTDDVLLAWLSRQVLTQVSKRTQADRCDTIFNWYVWLETNGYTKGGVKIPTLNDDFKGGFRLTGVMENNSFGQYRRTCGTFVSSVRPRPEPTTQQHTPDQIEVAKLYEVSDKENNPHLTKRNHLMMDWCVRVGLRRLEVAALTIDQIPEFKAIDALAKQHYAHELLLVRTKGSKKRRVGVMPELLERTRFYIEGPRAQLLAQFEARHRERGLAPPTEIFLSSKTGRGLVLNAISNMVGEFFDHAEVEGHLHRLRASYLTLLFESEINAEYARIARFPKAMRQPNFELILLKVAERAGHSHPESLRPYLVIAMKREARAVGVDASVNFDQRMTLANEKIATLERENKRLMAQLAKLSAGGEQALGGP